MASVRSTSSPASQRSPEPQCLLFLSPELRSWSVPHPVEPFFFFIYISLLYLLKLLVKTVKLFSLVTWLIASHGLHPSRSQLWSSSSPCPWDEAQKLLPNSQLLPHHLLSWGPLLPLQSSLSSHSCLRTLSPEVLPFILALFLSWIPLDSDSSLPNLPLHFFFPWQIPTSLSFSYLSKKLRWNK